MTAAMYGMSSDLSARVTRRIGSSFVVQTPEVMAFGPKDGPMDRPEPDDGRNGSMARDSSMSRLPTSVHAPDNGSDAATLVRSNDPLTAAAMNTVPPRRYRP